MYKIIKDFSITGMPKFKKDNKLNLSEERAKELIARGLIIKIEEKIEEEEKKNEKSKTKKSKKL